MEAAAGTPEPFIGSDVDAVTVLIVDDDPNIRLIMDEILTADDRTLVFADSGEAALRVLRQLTPAAILLDVHMAGMSGFETARLIRGRPRLSGIPIVFMTGVSTDELAVEKGYQLGAVDYLLKPIIPEVLESKVAAFCTLAQQRQLLESQRDKLKVAETRLQEANNALRRLATTDALTGLGNRAHFDEELRALHERSIRTNAGYAVLMVDLNRFKQVNDEHGHAAGDRVLINVAARLRQATRPGDTAFRLGGDEFCVLVSEIVTDQDVVALGHRIATALDAAHVLDSGDSVCVPGSLGVALFDVNRPVPSSRVLASADAAMYRAKSNRSAGERSCVELAGAADLNPGTTSGYSPIFDVAMVRSAVDFRPVVELESGRLYSIDALPWLQRDVEPETPAATQILHASDSGAVRQLSMTVLREALARWPDLPLRLHAANNPTLGLSLDPRAWSGPDLVKFVSEWISTGAGSASELILWIGERALARSRVELLAALGELGRAGVAVGIDQVGAAFPLFVLGECPITLLRTDAALLASRNVKALSAIASLANSCGMTAIGCGVTGPDQVRLLQECGFELGQGGWLESARPPESISSTSGAAGRRSE